MKLKPQQINQFLENLKFSVVSHTDKICIWRYKHGEYLIVNVKNISGKSALVIDPGLAARVSELQSVNGVSVGSEYIHHSNMTVFPKRLNQGGELIHYGIPVSLESENSLIGLLKIVYPSLTDELVDAGRLSFAGEVSAPESQRVTHSELLAWFEQRTGQVLTWEQLQNAPSTVVISAKGIYKPKESDYALSISQRLDSPYSDQMPVYQENGSWHYTYAQEESPRGSSTKLFTNQGLYRCKEDGVPVAVLVQLTKKPQVTTYRVLGLAKVISWEKGFFTLESTTLSEDGITISAANESSTFSPDGVEDNRTRTLKEITLRQGQGAFRSGLLTAYEGRCAISGSAVQQVLEAAHVTPYLGKETNHISNGLLLRSDLHTLWDRGLIYLCEELKLQLKPSLDTSEYASLAGEKIRARVANTPELSMAAVRAHREWCCKT